MDDVRQDKSKKVDKNIKSGQLGLYFDQTRCDSCYSCVVACKDWNNVPPGPANWLKITTINRGKYPQPFMAFLLNNCYHCQDAPCLKACPVEAITKDGENGIVSVDGEKCLGRDECGRPCNYECPIGNDIMGFITLVREKRYAEAWKLLLDSNPFPGVCGRVCDHPCEMACNRSQIDESVAIHALERFVADYEHMIPPFVTESKSQRVAVVGSGPAGLSCAYHLARVAYRVTVFEAMSRAGGMMQVGIPDYRLPKDILNREIALIESTGVKILTGVKVGKDISLEDLENFDAVFLAVGAHRERKVDLPDSELAGVTTGLKFLKVAGKIGQQFSNKKIVVLGGGNVAFDCARTAIRLGSKQVDLICPECLEGMLASPSEIEQGLEEGVKINPNTTLTGIHSLKGRVTAVDTVGIKDMSFNEEGKLSFKRVSGSEDSIRADVVIMAIGQDPDLDFLPEEIGISRGRISTDLNGMTSYQKYFAGGDAALNPGESNERKVSKAIGSGRRVAQAIDRFIRNMPAEERVVKTRFSELKNVEHIEKRKASGPVLRPVEERKNDFDEVECGFTEEEAGKEANRCLICEGMCSVACPYDAPQFGAENNPKMQKCNFCLEEWVQGKQPICVRSCTMRALDFGTLEELQNKYGNIKQAEGFTCYEKVAPSIIFKPKTFIAES